MAEAVLQKEPERVWALRFSESEWWDGGVSKISSDSPYVALNHTTDITNAITFHSREALKEAVRGFDDKLLNLSSKALTENMIADVTSYIQGDSITFTPWRDEQTLMVYQGQRLGKIQFELASYVFYLFNPGHVPEKMVLRENRHKEVILEALKAATEYLEGKQIMIQNMLTPIKSTYEMFAKYVEEDNK